MSRISYAVARGRTRFWARRTRGAIPPTLPKPVDQSDRRRSMNIFSEPDLDRLGWLQTVDPRPHL